MGVQDGSGNPPRGPGRVHDLLKVRDGSEDEWLGPFEGTRWVERSFGRSGTGWRTLPVVRDELGTLREVWDGL